MSKIYKVIVSVSPPIVSALMLILMFPKYNYSWLAWVGLVPLLIILSYSHPIRSFFLSYLCGILYFAFVFDWMFAVPNYTFIHQTILFLYLGSYFGLFGFAFSLLCKRSHTITAMLVAPFIWTSIEFLRSNMGFMAHPAALLGQSQYAHPMIIQIASLTGIYGVSFLIVSVNSAFATLFFLWLQKFQKNKHNVVSHTREKGAVVILGTTLALCAFALYYGYKTVTQPITGKCITISVVQGNIEQNKKWDPKFAQSIMQTYADLTRDVVSRQPALIIWPEAATPHAITQDIKLYNDVRQIAQKSGTCLLLGSTSHQKLKSSETKEVKYRNSAFLIPPTKGKVQLQRYDKMHLLAFGEYLPLKEVIPWFILKVPDLGSYIPGKKFTVFEHPDFRFSTAICWESLFPNLIRGFVQRGAQFIVNITNEAWFGRSSGPYQFLLMSVFRAVENHTYMVRCTNTGISCFVDPYGRIFSRLTGPAGDDIFVRGVLTDTIKITNIKTFYSQYGDVFAWLCVVVSFGFMLAVSVKDVNIITK